MFDASTLLQMHVCIQYQKVVLITLMISAGNALRELTTQRGPGVANVIINILQNVNEHPS